MEVRRGDLVTIALSGDYGKPRPALVVQDDAFATLDSVTVLRITSELQGAPLVRINLSPNPGNGLRAASQVMIDKAATLPRKKLGKHIGRVSAGTMQSVDEALARFLGLVR